MLRSVSKMLNYLITGGNLLNLKFTPNALETKEGRGKNGGYDQDILLYEGWHVQFNIVSSETLRRHRRIRTTKILVREGDTAHRLTIWS